MRLVTGLLIISLALSSIIACSGKKVVMDGDKVKVHYVGTFKDGTKFDSSENRDPLEFTVGSGDVIPGFDEGVLGLAAGDSNRFEILPENAYGNMREEMIFNVARTEIPPNIQLEVGGMMTMGGPQGKTMQVKIIEIQDDSVKLDGNHPLAGKTLVFDIKLVEIVPKEG